MEQFKNFCKICVNETFLFCFGTPFLLVFLGACSSLPAIKVNTHTYSNSIPDGAYLLIVESKRPWYAADFLIKLGIKNAIPEYQNAAGLIRKNFTIGHDGLFGGLYTWKDRLSLETFYGEPRIKAVEEKRGMRPILSIFKILKSKDFPIGLPASSNAAKEWDGDFVVSLVNQGKVAENQKSANEKFEKLNSEIGQITSYLVAGDDGNVYDIRLWINRSEMESKLNQKSSKDFDSPILIEGLNPNL